MLQFEHERDIYYTDALILPHHHGGAGARWVHDPFGVRNVYGPAVRQVKCERPEWPGVDRIVKVLDSHRSALWVRVREWVGCSCLFFYYTCQVFQVLPRARSEWQAAALAMILAPGYSHIIPSA
jgi:hypothetical protein